MKTKLGGLIVLVGLSSAVMMLGYTKYVPESKPAPAARESAVIIERESPSSATPSRPAQADPKPATRPDKPSVTPAEGKPESAGEFTLFVPRATENDFQLVPVRRKVADATPLAALKALASFDSNGPEDAPLPKGTKVRSLKVGPSGLAVADFSREIVDNFPGGSQTEQIMLSSIVNTLTQFRTINRVVITVEGKSVDSIGGHIDLEEPLTRDLGPVAKRSE